MRTRPLLTLVIGLCGGFPPGSTEKDEHTVTEGRSVTVRCLTQRGREQFFCKDDCDGEGNTLVQSSGVEQSSGRYSIGFDGDVTCVTIRDAVSSDSGSYGCEAWSGAVKVDFQVFQINVISEVGNGTNSQWQDPSAGPPWTGPALYPALAAALALIAAASGFLFWKTRVNRRAEFEENAQKAEEEHLYEDIPEETRCPAVYSLLSEPAAPGLAEDGSCKVPQLEYLTEHRSAPCSQTGIDRTVLRQ